MEIKAEFSSYDQLAKYFHDALLKKKHKINLIIGGKQKDNTIYSSLNFRKFIFEGDNFEEKEYEVDSAEYKRVLQIEKGNGNNPIPTTNSPVINSAMTGGNNKLPWQA
jgi:hypothetical protein